MPELVFFRRGEEVRLSSRPVPSRSAGSCDIRATWRRPSPWGNGAGACSFPGPPSWQEAYSPSAASAQGEVGGVHGRANRPLAPPENPGQKGPKKRADSLPSVNEFQLRGWEENPVAAVRGAG
jgi:hypothetical protein